MVKNTNLKSRLEETIKELGNVINKLLVPKKLN